MDRDIDRLIVKNVLKLPMAQTSESYIDGWLDNQNFYSSRIEDAWKVADIMREYGDFTLYKDFDSHEWTVELALSTLEIYSVSDESVCKAICTLALNIFKTRY